MAASRQLESGETVLRRGSAPEASLLTAGTEVDHILGEQGVQLVVLHQGVFKLLQHLKHKCKFLLFTQF